MYNHYWVILALLVVFSVLIIYLLGGYFGFFSTLFPLLFLSFLGYRSSAFYKIEGVRLKVKRFRQFEYVELFKIQKLVKFSNKGIMKWLFGEDGIEIHFDRNGLIKLYPENIENFDKALRDQAKRIKQNVG